MIVLNRTILSIAVITVALAVAVVWSLSFLSDASNDAGRAAADVAATHLLTERIESLQPLGVAAASRNESASHLPAILDDAMKSAEIDVESLDRITPQAPRRIEQSDTAEIPVEVVFQNVTLRQLLTFLTSLIRGNDWICVRKIHLIHPVESLLDEADVRWNVEITLSYLAPSSIAGDVSAAAN